MAELADVVRHSLAARTRDRHLIEDLTQETLVRLAATDHELAPDEQKAYAIVTARNLLTSHARHQAVRQRYIHRLAEDAAREGPEQRTLDREQNDALVTALERLDPEDRRLLLRHEADGTDLATLADEADVTPGAMAMRLARARAELRLEFLLAFRRVRLPTARCRPVLLALSNGDRRRQAALDAPAHLASCPTCAALAEPLTRRKRRVVAWLLLPLAEGIRRAWRRLTSRSFSDAAAAMLAGVTLALLVGPEPPIADPPPATVPMDPAAIPTLDPQRSTPGAQGVPTGTTAVPVPTTTVAPPPPAPATPNAGNTPVSTSPCLITIPVDQLDAATEALCAVVTTVVSAVGDPVGAVPTTTVVALPGAPSGLSVPSLP